MKKVYRCIWENVRRNPFISAAMMFVKADIQKYNQYKWLIHTDIPGADKVEMENHIKKIDGAVAELQTMIEPHWFDISYRHFFDGTACHVLAELEYHDKSTIVKNNQKFILKLTELLYPQYFDWMHQNE